MRKILPPLLLVILVAGCTSLKNKAFRSTSAGVGGKMVVVDPATANILPTFVGGSFYNSITTIPDKLDRDIKYKSTTYSWWGTKLVEEEITLGLKETGKRRPDD